MFRPPFFKLPLIILALCLACPASGSAQEPMGAPSREAGNTSSESATSSATEGNLHKETVRAPSRERGTASSEIAPSREVEGDDRPRYF
jgi:hypothetical protein